MPRLFLSLLLALGLALAPCFALAEGPVVEPLPVGGPQDPNNPAPEPGSPPTVIRQETYIIHQIQLSSRTVQDALDAAIIAALDPVDRDLEEAGRRLDAALAQTSAAFGLINGGRLEAAARLAVPLAVPLAVVVFLLRLARYHWERLSGGDDALFGVVADWVSAAGFALLSGPILALILAVAVWLGEQVNHLPLGELSGAALLAPRPATGGPILGFLGGLFLAVLSSLVVGLVTGLLTAVLLFLGLFYLLALLGPVAGVLSALPELRWVRGWWLKAAFLLAFLYLFFRCFWAFGQGALSGLGHGDISSALAQTAVAGSGFLLMLGMVGGMSEFGVAHAVQAAGRIRAGVAQAVHTLSRAHTQVSAEGGGSAPRPGLGHWLAAGALAGLGAPPEVVARPLAARSAVSALPAPAAALPAPTDEALARQEAAALRASLAGSSDPRAQVLDRFLTQPQGHRLVAELRRRGVLEPGADGLATPESRSRALRGLLEVARILERGGAPDLAYLSHPKVPDLVARAVEGPLDPAAARAELGLEADPDLYWARRLADEMGARYPEGRAVRELLRSEAGPALVAALRQAGVDPGHQRLPWALRLLVAHVPEEAHPAFHRDPAGAARLISHLLEQPGAGPDLDFSGRVMGWLEGHGFLPRSMPPAWPGEGGNVSA